MYQVTNEIYAFRNSAQDVADNGECGDQATGIKVAPGGINGDASPLYIVWQWSNGDPTFIAALDANLKPYGPAMELHFDENYEPEWLQQFGAPAGREREWLCKAVQNAMPAGDDMNGLIPVVGW